MGGMLDDKVAIVTGGAAGIGRATVELFVAQGARVVIADIDDAKGSALADSLGASAAYLHTDVGDKAQLQALVDFAVRRFGGLHIMVNNAGLSDSDLRPLLENDLASFHRVIDVNLLGVIAGTQYAARHMAAHGGGSIINTSSIAGLQPGFGFVAYRSAKAGVIHFTKNAAIELGKHLIRVNCICPGNIPTDMGRWAVGEPGMSAATSRRIREGVNDVRMRRQALKRQGTTDDVAQAALFLGSDQSRQITGLIMPVDAGTAVGDALPLMPEILAARGAAIAEGDG